MTWYRWKFWIFAWALNQVSREIDTHVWHRLCGRLMVRGRAVPSNPPKSRWSTFICDGWDEEHDYEGGVQPIEYPGGRQFCAGCDQQQEDDFMLSDADIDQESPI